MSCAATIYVKHLEAMVAFYEACFGFRVVDRGPGEYHVLQSRAWSLSIVQVPEEVAVSFEISIPPVRRASTPIKLTFDVSSIDAVRSTIAELGGRVDGTPWEFRGFRHCDCTDPEGNVAQLREPLGSVL